MVPVIFKSVKSIDTFCAFTRGKFKGRSESSSVGFWHKADGQSESYGLNTSYRPILNIQRINHSIGMPLHLALDQTVLKCDPLAQLIKV